jgi:hypothetical protein
VSERAAARLIGALFIVASATAIIGGSLLLPVDDAESTTTLAGDETRLATGALLELVLVWSVIGIAALFFPVLKRRDEGLALAYVGARIVEASLLLAATVSAVAAVAVSKRGVDGAASAVDVLSITRERTYVLGSLLAFGVGALILYGLLYRSRLVPDWLALWGLIGAVLVTARGAIELYGTDPPAAVQGLLAAPVAVNEMVLAVWLIVKGFGSSSGERRAVDHVLGNGQT